MKANAKKLNAVCQRKMNKNIKSMSSNNYYHAVDNNKIDNPSTVCESK